MSKKDKIPKSILEFYVTKSGRHSWRLFDFYNHEKLARGSHGRGWATARGALANAKSVIRRFGCSGNLISLPRKGAPYTVTWHGPFRAVCIVRRAV